MKNAVLIFVSGIMGILMLAMILTISGDMNHEIEVQTNLPIAMERTLKLIKEQEAEYDRKDAIAECVESIALMMDAEADVQINVYQVDVERGMMAIGLSELFLHPNNMSAKAEYERTIICEKEAE